MSPTGTVKLRKKKKHNHAYTPVVQLLKLDTLANRIGKLQI